MWVVVEHFPYEGYSLPMGGVFSTKEKAEKWVEVNLYKKDQKDINYYEVDVDPETVGEYK